jgi:predicted outer membrane repeat protein
MIILIPVAANAGRLWTVDPGGSGDVLTIEAGLDSASAGDTVEVVCGTYYEYGLVMKDSVFLASTAYSQTCVTIDAQGQGRVLTCDGVSADTWIVGFTIKGGNASGSGEAGSGGGIACINYSYPHISSVSFEGNSADHMGGGLYCGNVSAPSLMFCYFRDNEAGYGGGAIGCNYYSPVTGGRSEFISNTTSGNGGAVLCEEMSHVYISRSSFVSNSAAGHGGGLCASVNSDPNIVRCIVAFGGDGEGVYSSDAGSEVTLTCCDIYGNADGDWVGSIAGQEGVDGNFAADPLFCDMSQFFLFLETCSPCATGNHPDAYDCGGYIGAADVACGCGEATEPTTWGAIKAFYR